MEAFNWLNHWYGKYMKMPSTWILDPWLSTHLTNIQHDYIIQILANIFILGSLLSYDDVIKWKHFSHYWPFVCGIHRSPVNSTHKGQWRGALMFSWICIWINGWVNNGEAGDLRCHHAHYDVILLNNILSYCCDKWWGINHTTAQQPGKQPLIILLYC